MAFGFCWYLNFSEKSPNSSGCWEDTPLDASIMRQMSLKRPFGESDDEDFLVDERWWKFTSETSFSCVSQGPGISGKTWWILKDQIPTSNSHSQDPFFRLPFIKMVLWMMVGARMCKATKAFSCFFLIRVFLIAILIMKIRKILTLVSLCWLTAPKTLQDDPESEWRRKVFQRTEEATSNSWRYWDYHDMYWDYPN